MGKQKTLILIDGHALAFRQYYALERTNMKTSDGLPTWAVYGFFKAIFDLLKNPDLRADAIAVAFDVSHHTFRTERYEGYKSNREAMPDPMQMQMQYLYEGLQAFNIPIYTKEGFEADDVIGTISKQACELGHKVLILTGDQDSFQLVDKDGCVKVIIPSKGDLIEYNWDKVYEKLGVYPNQVVDYKALRGDTSDCIPGIKGIGEKTAQKLLDRYKTLEEILNHCEEIPEKSVREKISNGKEDALMSQYLATIIRDLDTGFDFEKTKVELPDLKDVTEFLTKMQFYSFIKNITNILRTFNKDVEIPNIEVNTQAEISPQLGGQGQLQLGFFANNSTSTCEPQAQCKVVSDDLSLKEFLDDINLRKIVAFQVFGDFLNAVRTDLVGVAFSFGDFFNYDGNKILFNKQSDKKSYYIPLNSGFDRNKILSSLKPVFEDEKIKKITIDCKSAYNFLRSNSIELRGVEFDIMLASYIQNPAKNHELPVQALEFLNHILCDFPQSESKKKNNSLKDFEPSYILNYVSDNIETVACLAEYWQNNLDEEELKILKQIEIPMAKVLADMEFEGVSVDTRCLKDLSDYMDAKIIALEKKIYELAGFGGFNINSPKQLGEVLFDKLGLKCRKKRKGNNYSTSAEVLEELAEDYEIAGLVLEYRKYTKLKSTYTDALPNLIDPKDNRIHTTYNQTTTTTGRLSSSNPNLQNIPARTAEGNKIRAAFVPQDRENSVILSADYSQIELRLLAHVAQDKNLIEAFKSGEDVHTLTASKVFEVPVEEVTKDMRSRAKAVNFGIVYGQSKYGLAKSLGITNDEAENFINKYFATYPNIKLYMNKTVMFAEQNGFVKTIFGRKRYLKDELESPNGMIREFAKRAAINQPIQGSAADLMKIAMIDFAKKLKENRLKSKMIIQVHDEIVTEVVKSELDEVTRLVKEAMELNQPLLVPLVIDINTGETWQE